MLIILGVFSGEIISGKEKEPYNNAIPYLFQVQIFRDSGLYDSLPREKKRFSDQFIDSLRTMNYRYKWMQTLSNIVILPPDTVKERYEVPTQRSEVDFVNYKGLIIRNIRFIKLDISEPNIFDTISKNVQLSKITNKIHAKTTDKALQRHLLFTSGDIIDPRVLSDNERILRDLSFIEDARIVVDIVDGFEDYADVTIIIKDRWSLAFYPDLSSIGIGKLEIWDKNILGSGNEFQNNIYWNDNKKAALGYEAIFTNRNIYGTFIDGIFEFKNMFETEKYSFTLERKFYTSNTRWAGGVSFFHTNTTRTINYLEYLESKVPVKCIHSDLWLGRSIYLNKFATIDKNRINLVFASRIYREIHFERPTITSNSFYEYHNKTVLLNSIGLSSQSYYRSNLIYSYGRTEDIPTGYHANFTFGPEFGEYSNRFYTSISLSKGNYIANAGYLFAKFSEGGFFNSERTFEQAMYQIDINFFTNLFILRNFKFRHFIGIKYTNGMRRFDYESINLNESKGITGFNQTTVYGNKKFVLNLETVTFTPYYILGFRFVGFGFLDLGLISEENKSLFEQDLYSGMGFGLRIQNERLVFPTFELRLGYYPPFKNISHYDLVRFLGDKKHSHENFFIQNPAIINYE